MAAARLYSDLHIFERRVVRQELRDLECACEAAAARVPASDSAASRGRRNGCARRPAAVRRQAARSAWSCRRRWARSAHAFRRRATSRDRSSVATKPPKRFVRLDRPAAMAVLTLASQARAQRARCRQSTKSTIRTRIGPRGNLPMLGPGGQEGLEPDQRAAPSTGPSNVPAPPRSP